MRPDTTAQQSGTDVRPRPDGQWLSTCECGRSSVQPGQAEGWSWVLDHGCPLDDELRGR